MTPSRICACHNCHSFLRFLVTWGFLLICWCQSFFWHCFEEKMPVSSALYTFSQEYCPSVIIFRSSSLNIVPPSVSADRHSPCTLSWRMPNLALNLSSQPRLASNISGPPSCWLKNRAFSYIRGPEIAMSRLRFCLIHSYNNSSKSAFLPLSTLVRLLNIFFFGDNTWYFSLFCIICVTVAPDTPNCSAIVAFLDPCSAR